MQKQISTTQLRVGMYLEKLPGSWLSNPFWKTSRLLESAEEIELVRKSGVRHAVIDTAKGLDVAPEASAAPPVTAAVQPPAAPTPRPPAPRPPPVKVSAEQEMKVAAQVIARSKAAVTAMFTDVRMGKAVDLSATDMVIDDISESIARNATALVSLARLKNQDDYTYMHSIAVCALMIALARQINLDPEAVREAGAAGLLHDIGKMAVPQAILNKPGKLSDDEFTAVRQHPQAGYDMLVQAGQIGEIAMDVCLHHHEKMDGSGYPHGLKGEQISLYARMGAICDVYDAITSDRAYKQGWPAAESIKKMASWCDTHFDAQLYRAFVKSVGIYPMGTLVRLTSGRLGVVIEQSETSLLTPRVRVFFSTKSNTHLTPVVIDLGLPGEREQIAKSEDPAQWNFIDLKRYWAA
ncbi:HD-GYP domain-containing protein [Noviherbaspirillum suwonense]|uniref:HDIG domain-containing protein n=1 Tax=Noviherbaspirillum suwonense TaxID=1224511 RepID=A0ABY1PSK2_9BURK|nr:HD-GYP domain-containing protein [Noviherbaspirillum suwonense]SMP40835.1 HDIG domain-containing protein [Noviherbaspirillum suwonense]